MDSYHKYTVLICKSCVANYVHYAKSLTEFFLTGNKIFTSLLDIFENVYISLIPEKTDDESYNLYLRFRMVIDYITSLTDTGIKDIYQKLMGL